jgi:hypothetical protein
MPVCNTCIETDLQTVPGNDFVDGGELIPARTAAASAVLEPPPFDVKKVRKRIRLEVLERNARLPVPLPICDQCGRPSHPEESHEMYGRMCLMCGINVLERLFFRLYRARGRKARQKALRKIASLARSAR